MYRRCVGKDVPNQLHGEFWRVYVSVPDHELLQYVILNGPVKLVLSSTLHEAEESITK